MITILVEFKFDKKDTLYARALLKQLASESLKEPGCVYYSAKQDSSDETKFILYEVFKDKDAQDFHKTTGHYQFILNDKLRPLIKERQVRFLV